MTTRVMILREIISLLKVNDQKSIKTFEEFLKFTKLIDFVKWKSLIAKLNQFNFAFENCLF